MSIATRRLGSYRLLRVLGRGGYGEVWECFDEKTQRHMALKVLTEVRRVSDRARDRFQREGQLAASLNHPRCVYVFGVEEIADPGPP